MATKITVSEEMQLKTCYYDKPLYRVVVTVENVEKGVYKHNIEDVDKIMLDNNCTFFYNDNTNVYSANETRFFKLNNEDDTEIYDTKYGVMLYVTRTHFTVRMENQNITDKLNITILYTKGSDEEVDYLAVPEE